MTHNIEIAGVAFSLVSDNDKKYVTELAAELSERIRRISISTTSATKFDAAVVCALDLLDENRRLRRENEELKKK